MAHIKKNIKKILNNAGGKAVVKMRTTLFKHDKKDLATLNDLFLVQMKDLYDTEKQIEKALPMVIKKTSFSDLKKTLEHHLYETKDQVKRIEKVYKLIGMSPKRQKSLGMEGLINDGKEVMSLKAEPELMDAAITANSQHIEHHEIAGYRSTIAWARILKLTSVAKLLELNLRQEENMDKKLNSLASQKVNRRAATA